MSETLVRQWAMLQLIPKSPQKISTPDIVSKLKRDRFEVTERTVQRDLAYLADIFPLVADTRNKPYGWQWPRDAQLASLPGMDPRTAMTLKLVEKFLVGILPKQALADFQPYLKQAGNVLKELGKSPYAKWSDIVAIVPRGQALLPAPVNAGVIDTVYEALFEGRRFKADYHHLPSDTKKKYDSINPLGLIFRDGVIYLVCTFYNYPHICQLALHRLTKADLLDEPVTPINGFDLEQYIRAEHAMDFPLDGGKEIMLEVLFDEPAGYHLMETPLSKNQTIEKTNDGRLRVTATVTETAQLHWWLLGFGAQVEVVKPATLRKVMADTSTRMAARYL